jgi:hypothetical protein
MEVKHQEEFHDAEPVLAQQACGDVDLVLEEWRVHCVGSLDFVVGVA